MINKQQNGSFFVTNDGDLKIAKLIGTGFVGLFLLILLLNTFYVVNAGERGVLLTFGSVDPVAKQPGLGVKVPIVQDIIRMNVQTLKYEADASAASKDLQVVTAKIATNYHLVPESVPTLYQNLGVDYGSRVIMPMEQEVTKSITAQFTAEELITKREEVRLKIKDTLKERLAERGIIVEEVSITNFDFSKSFNDAIEYKVTMEQNALAAKNKLEQIKFEAQQKVEAAKGEAESIQIIQEQIKQSPQYIELIKVQKWDGKLSLVVGGGNIPMINIGTPTQTPTTG